MSAAEDEELVSLLLQMRTDSREESHRLRLLSVSNSDSKAWWRLVRLGLREEETRPQVLEAAVAVFANLVTEDGEESKHEAYTKIDMKDLLKLMLRSSATSALFRTRLLASIALANVARQSKAHRAKLVELDGVEGMLEAIAACMETIKEQQRGGDATAEAKQSELAAQAKSVLDSTALTLRELLRIEERESWEKRARDGKVLSVLMEAADDKTIDSRSALQTLAALLPLDPSQLVPVLTKGLSRRLRDGTSAEIYASLSEPQVLQPVTDLVLMNSKFLSSTAEYLTSSVLRDYSRATPPDEITLACVELFAKTLFSLRNHHAEEASKVFPRIEASNLNCVFVEIVEKTTRVMIQVREDRGASREAELTQHARLRLSALTCLCSLSATKESSEVLISRAKADVVLTDLVTQFAEHDYEGTRASLNCLRNFALADPTCRVARTALAHVGKLAASRDVNSASLSAGIWRLCLLNYDSTKDDARHSRWAELVEPKGLQRVLELDLTKVHPVARVELTRAVAAALRLLPKISRLSTDSSSSREEEELSSANPLETAETIRFVVFLLQAPQVNLRMEALSGVVVSPVPALKAGIDEETKTRLVELAKISESTEEKAIVAKLLGVLGNGA